MDDRAATEEIQRLEAQRWASIVASDFDTLTSLIDDDLVYIHASGLVENKKAYLTTQSTGQAISAEPLGQKIRVVGDSAVITGKVRFTIVRNGENVPLDLLATSVWVRRDDSWRFFSWQAMILS